MSEILFADDDDAMRGLVGEMLRAAGYQARLVDGGHAALAEVRTRAPDMVVLDYRMGTPDGFQVCREIKADPRLAHIPVLILTGEGEVERRIQGFEAGADDYLGKPFDPRELLARIHALLRLMRLGLDRNPTTGLPGGEALEREFQRRVVLGEPFSICYLDLDHFKPFNDRFGFAIADSVIRGVGQALATAAVEADAFAGHVGGDDFVFLCPDRDVPALVARSQDGVRTSLLRHLPADVVEAGYFAGVDREGHARDFPLTRLAAAVVHVAPGSAATLAELSELAAETKKRAKQMGDGGIAEASWPPSGDGSQPDLGGGGMSSRHVA